MKIERLRLRRVLLLAAALAVPGCGKNSTGPAYAPVLPTAWATAVTNRFFPLQPGTTTTFEGQTSVGLERGVTQVLSTTRVIQGVTATTVLDRVFLQGSLIEETTDWYAQDQLGNVWYLGEDSKEYQNGQVVGTKGSWVWGANGALPGIIMWADPGAHIGEAYRQEYFKGEAEDWAKTIALGMNVTVGTGNLTGCLQTEDWSALEAGSNQYKYYCPQIGIVAESKLNGSERVQLVQRTTR